MEVQPHTFLTSAPNGGEWLVMFIPRPPCTQKKSPAHNEQEAGRATGPGWGGGGAFCCCQMEFVRRLITVMTELSRLHITVKQKVYNYITISTVTERFTSCTSTLFQNISCATLLGGFVCSKLRSKVGYLAITQRGCECRASGTKYNTC
jgi:hypothetical protein